MTKSWKLALGMMAVATVLTSAHAKKSLLANHANMVACSDCDVPGMPLFTTFGSSMGFVGIAEDGTVLFTSNLAGPTITTANSRAMFAGTTYADIAAVAQWSDPAPGLPGLFLNTNSGSNGIVSNRIAPDGGMLWTGRLTNPHCVGGSNPNAECPIGNECTGGGTCTRDLPASVDSAIFGGTPGNFSLIAREGSPAPGAVPHCVGGSNPDAACPIGNECLGGGSCAPRQCFGGSNPGAPCPVGNECLSGGTCYAPAGVVVYAGDQTSLNQQSMAIARNGRIMFQTFLSGSSTYNGAIYGGTIGAPTLVVRKGDIMLPGITAAEFSSALQTQMDNNGRIVHALKLGGAGVTTANDDSLWLYTPGSGNTLLVREGSLAPGTAGAILGKSDDNWHAEMSVNSFTRGGKYSFVCDLKGGDVIPGVNDVATYIGATSGGLTLLIRKGAPAPGTDGVFASLHPQLTYVADSGRVAFQGTLTGGTVVPANDSGIWVGTAGALSLVAREGALAPGTDGAKFDSLIGLPMDYSDFGILFQANLVGGDVARFTNNRATFAWTPANGTFLVARSGDTMEVAPGMFKITQNFGILQFNNTDGASLGFSNDGRIATSTSFGVSTSGTATLTLDLNCAPATDYYLDSDGDTYGDPTTEINLCAGGVPPPGYITRSGDCLDANPAALGQSPETCNGIDDDCDAMIDESIPAPSAPLDMTLTKAGANATLSWAPVPGATAYDVITGGLNDLRSLHSFWPLTSGVCVGQDVTATQFPTSGTPSPGNGFFWLIRPLNCDADGTWSSGSPKERPGRDAEINSNVQPYYCQ